MPLKSTINSTLLVMANETEQKILAAAMKVFKQKGFDAARSRDIAAEAGLSHALINYHFGNKENLFNMVMKQTLINFSQHMECILNNPNTSYKEKITIFIENINNLMTHDPQLVQFFLTQLINNKEMLINEINPKEKILGSLFYQQLRDNGFSNEQCLNLYINFVGMTVVTIIGKPMIQSVNNLSDDAYLQLINQRAQMIPTWLEQMFNLP